MAWRALPGLDVRRLEAVALDVGTRLRDLETIKSAVVSTAEKTAKHTNEVWGKSSVAAGSAGLAVMFSYLDDCYPGDGWDFAGKQHLELAAKGVESSNVHSIGLFGGVVGVAFAAQCLSRAGTRYQGLLASLDDVICTELETHCFELKMSNGAVSPTGFDAVSGVSGALAYLLSRFPGDSSNPSILTALETLLWLAEGDGIPRWHTPPSRYLNPVLSERFPFGILDCGLAHGIPGPLAAMSLALLNGVELPGLPECTRRVGNWLVQHCVEDGYGLNWPSMIGLQLNQENELCEMEIPRKSSVRGRSRTAWCYGTPGICRSLWLAGKAIDCSEFREVAIAGMHAVAHRPLADRVIDSPTFCHGIAGLLQITMRFLVDVDDESLSEDARLLANTLADAFDPTSLLGYRDIDNEGRYLDNPALLEGVAAIPLVLLAATTNVQPTWDRLFLLS